jgi:multiple sugar transport system permease protein
MNRIETNSTLHNTRLSVYKVSFWKRINKFSSYLFILPGLLFLLAFMVYPIFYNLILSFKNVTIMNLLGVQQFVGLSNYTKVLNDPMFSLSFKNSIIFTGLCIFFQFIIGFALAFVFNKKFAGRDTMRSMIMLAWMMPVVIVGTLYQWMLAGDSSGILNYFLLSLNFIKEPIMWLSSPEYAMYGIIIANIWVGVPFNMMILLAGLQAIPDHLYEAAKIDGAGKFRQFIHITLPFMRPTILILLMLGIIATFKVFDLMIVMTGGGPVNSTTVLPYYAYKLAFNNLDFSLGAAVSTIMFGVLMFVAVVYLWLMRKEEQL